VVALAVTAPAKGEGSPDAVAVVALAVVSSHRSFSPAEGEGSPDAVAVVALAAVTAPTESALEFAREAHTTAGPFEHTPAYFYDPDDPNFGFGGQTCLGGGDWGDFGDGKSCR
jgi:hypothetical protein